MIVTIMMMIMMTEEEWEGDGRGEITSIQFSRSVVPNSLHPHALQHARPPCPLPTPGVYSNSCSLSQWCHPTIWVNSLHQVAKVLEFQLQYQSFQWIVREYWFPEFKGNIQRKYRFPLGLTGWLSRLSKGLSKSLLQHHSSKASILRHSAFFIVQLSHPTWLLEKP